MSPVMGKGNLHHTCIINSTGFNPLAEIKTCCLCVYMFATQDNVARKMSV